MMKFMRVRACRAVCTLYILVHCERCDHINQILYLYCGPLKSLEVSVSR